MIDAAGLPETLDSEPVAADFHDGYDAGDIEAPPFEVDEPAVLTRQAAVIIGSKRSM